MRCISIASSTILLALCVLTPTFALPDFIISRVYFNLRFGSFALVTKTGLPSSRRPCMEPVLGQCAVMVSLLLSS